MNGTKSPYFAAAATMKAVAKPKRNATRAQIELPTSGNNGVKLEPKEEPAPTVPMKKPRRQKIKPEIEAGEIILFMIFSLYKKYNFS